MVQVACLLAGAISFQPFWEEGVCGVPTGESDGEDVLFLFGIRWKSS